MPTVNSCLEAFRRLFVISDIEAWCPALRSSTGIRSRLKRGMCDSSVAAAALGTKPDYLLKDFKTFGFLFKALSCAT